MTWCVVIIAEIIIYYYTI